MKRFVVATILVVLSLTIATPTAMAAPDKHFPMYSKER